MIRAIFKRFGIVLPPLPTPPPPHTPERSTLLQLGVIILVAMIGHFAIADPIVAIFALAVWLLKFIALFLHRNTPPQLLIILLTIFSFALVLLLYGGWNGQKAGISFLALLSALKYLESRTLRDYYVTCLILYFLGACSFLFYSSVFNIFTVVIFSLAVTSVLIQLSNPIPVRMRAAWASSIGILLKALPLAIILFFFFPRIQGSFGFLPTQDELSNRQLSNSMEAGDFANSAFNDALAFRVSFAGDIPTNKQLYWRSKVMPIEDNFRWLVGPTGSRDASTAVRMREQASLSKGDYQYEILHEKSTDLFLPYLDYVSGYSEGSLLADYSVTLQKQKVSDFSYRGSASKVPSLPQADSEIHRRLMSSMLQTQSSPSARTQLLMDRWQSQAKSKQELAQLIFDYFTEQEFRYSLLPPSLGSKPLDEFLFETQTGYCEHYAGVFTTLMRWMGVPARVVVGYQGGQRNKAGDYLEIRYYDAHAWSEIYIDGQWRRMDPTATITPERIDFGMEALLDLWDGSYLRSNESGMGLQNFLNPGAAQRAFQRVRDSWDNASYQWNKWVVNYDFDRQKQLLENIGLNSSNSLYTLVGLLFSGCIALILFYFWQLIPKPIKRGAAQKAYLQFVGKFSRHKIDKELSDTPNHFAEKVILHFPHLRAQIESITQSYLDLRYGPHPGSIKAFKDQVKQFKLSRSNAATNSPIEGDI